MIIPTSQEAIQLRRALADYVMELFPGSSLETPTEERETVQLEDGSYSTRIKVNGDVAPLNPASLNRILKDVFTKAYALGKADAIAHLAPEAEK